MSFVDLINKMSEDNFKSINDSSIAPIGGEFNKLNDKLANEYKVIYFIADITEESDRRQLEYIMSEALKPDPLYIIIREDSTFTKEGSYKVAIKALKKIEK